jgi:maltooligosyltrehalose trehalohydrolase
LNDPRYISPISTGGYGLDGQWVDEFHHALHSLVTGEVDGYYEDFGSTDHLVRSLRYSYVYNGEYSIHRKKLFGKKPEGTTYDQFVVFAQNHDQVGNRMLGDRLSTLISRKALKLAACAFILSPHVPLLFMGEEYGEKNPFQYFVSHTDEELVKAVRQGRREEFAYFKWKGEVPDPQSEDTFRRCMLSWDSESAEGREMLSLYQHLIELRKSRPVLREKGRDSLSVLPSQDHVVAYERKGEADRLVLALNFGKESSSLAVPHGVKLRRMFDSASARWGGPAADDKSERVDHVQLYPESLSIFEFV